MDGILVGSDQTLEWAIPWWLEHYQKHNTASVAFIDFGLSFEMKQWCRKRGELIPIRIVDFAEEVPSELAKQWEKESGKQFQESRSIWLKKPFACLQSPFDRTLWIDVDCEIKGSLTPLFEYANDFGMVIDDAVSSPYPSFNAGLIAFRKEHPILKKWWRWCLSKNRFFKGDQDLLCRMLFEEKIEITKIPMIYNWSRLYRDNPGAIILHWHGYHGKFVIRNQIKNFSGLLEL